VYLPSPEQQSAWLKMPLKVSKKKEAPHGLKWHKSLQSKNKIAPAPTRDNRSIQLAYFSLLEWYSTKEFLFRPLNKSKYSTALEETIRLPQYSFFIFHQETKWQSRRILIHADSWV